MRGKGPRRSQHSGDLRITPAHAGKRRCSRQQSAWPWDHPRACGEKLFWVFFVVQRQGITPAHAGKRFIALTLSCSLKDHPRACGEKSRFHPARNRNQGSPPRMRGKDLQFSAKLPRERITPAHAGKRSSLYPFSIAQEDHPRACGEKESLRAISYAGGGSPPRMRGKEELQVPRLPGLRITPAHAGKRWRRAI